MNYWIDFFINLSNFNNIFFLILYNNLAFQEYTVNIFTIFICLYIKIKKSFFHEKSTLWIYQLTQNKLKPCRTSKTEIKFSKFKICFDCFEIVLIASNFQNTEIFKWKRNFLNFSYKIGFWNWLCSKWTRLIGFSFASFAKLIFQSQLADVV